MEKDATLEGGGVGGGVRGGVGLRFLKTKDATSEGGGGRGWGGTGAPHDCVDVVLVKLRREVEAGALRVLQRIADAQVECGASPVMGTSTDLQKRDK